MKSLSSILPAALLVLLVVSFNSCKKVTEDQLIKGLWLVNGVYVDSMSNNYLDRLPHYTDGHDCCFYKMDFERDGSVIVYYLTYNDFNYVTPGKWYLNHYNEIYIKVDNFIDGTFDIAKPSLKHWRLTTDMNHVAAFDSINPQIDTTYTKIEMEKI